MPQLREKVQRIRAAVLDQAFDGVVFADHAVRNEEGKLVHINYWFGKKAAGAEILDEELTAVQPKSKGQLLLLASAVLFLAGIVLLVL